MHADRKNHTPLRSAIGNTRSGPALERSVHDQAQAIVSDSEDPLVPSQSAIGEKAL